MIEDLEPLQPCRPAVFIELLLSLHCSAMINQGLPTLLDRYVYMFLSEEILILKVQWTAMK